MFGEQWEDGTEADRGARGVLGRGREPIGKSMGIRTSSRRVLVIAEYSESL